MRYDLFEEEYNKFQHDYKRDFTFFKNAYSDGTWTKTASSSIIFGLPARVSNLKMYNDVVSKEITGIYEVFRALGFKSNFITSNVITSAAFGYDKAFDFFYDTQNENEGFNLSDVISAKTNNLFSKYIASESFRIVPSFFLHNVFFENVDLRENNISFIWSMDTHDPYYDIESYTRKQVIPSFITHKDITSKKRDLHLLKRAKDLHRLSIRHNMKTFFHFLEQIDKITYQDTMIFLIADHGEAFGEKGLVSHNVCPIQELIRIPFCVKFPGDKQLYRNRIITTLDIIPTVLKEIDADTYLAPFGFPLQDKVNLPWRITTEYWTSREKVYTVYINLRERLKFIENSSNKQTNTDRAKDLIRRWMINRLGWFKLPEERITFPRNKRHVKALMNEYMELCTSFSFATVSQENIDSKVEDRLKALGYL